jgi:type I restriction enzyme S subunit
VSVDDDGITFDAATLAARPIREGAEYNGLRVQFEARLGAARIRMQVDIGFGNAIEPPPTEADYPSLLELPLPRIRAYPQEAVVAEKLHAMVVLGERNSRYKDFYDLYVFARQLSFDGERLTMAIAATFERRRTTIEPGLPAALSPRFYTDDERARQWRGYLTRNALPGAPTDWAAVGELLQAFLAEPWRALAGGRTFSNRWSPGGPWVASLLQGPVAAKNVQCVLRRFKPYPTYKDSGIEWLGDIPAHWGVVRADAIFRYEKLQIEPAGLTDEYVLHYSIPSVQEIGNGRLEPPSEIDSAKLQIKGTRLLVSKLNPRKGTILIASKGDVTTICSTEFLPLEVRVADIRWALYLFIAESTRQRLSAGVRSATRSHQRAEVADILKAWHAVPPPNEQRGMSAFLDREAAKIDALVEKKEQLIALLQEKRIALITRAVTKGLDPNAPMSDSGVEWLGEIPAHWGVARLASLTNRAVPIVYGILLPGPRLDDGVPYIGAGDVNERMRLDHLPRTTEEIASQYPRSRVQAGEIVYAIRGSFGAVELVPPELEGANLSRDAARVSPATGVVARWLCWALRSDTSQKQFDFHELGATITGVNIRDLKRVLLPCPSAVEQKAIGDHLDEKTAKIDALLVKIREAIDRLKELRTALISAAVTGKIDVREEVA